MTTAERSAAARSGPEAPVLSVVVPTRNERDNVAPLLAALGDALAGLDTELVVVDDSDDGTADEFARCAGRAPFPVRIAVRRPDDARRGLGWAVVRGFGSARGEFVCVMDADLQHPPALARTLLAVARRERADVVIASRYVPGGSATGLGGVRRRLASRGLGLLARLAFPGRVGPVRDPMSGYFLVRRALLDGVALRPVGYKILVEVLVRCRPRRVREVPYRMHPRHAGRTKTGVREGLNVLCHLLRLRTGV
jgi:dolichol-phosphate mannosyltransferase